MSRRVSSVENKENMPPPDIYRAKVPQRATASSKYQENLNEDMAGLTVQQLKRRCSSTSSVPQKCLHNSKLFHTNVTTNNFVKREIDSILKPQESVKVFTEYFASTTSTFSTNYPKSASCVSTSKFSFDFAKTVIKQEVVISASRKQSTNTVIQKDKSRASLTSPCKGKPNAVEKTKVAVYEDKAKVNKVLKPLERYLEFESDFVRKAENKRTRLAPILNKHFLCPNENLPSPNVNCLKRSIPATKYSPILPNVFTYEYVLISKKPQRLRKPKLKQRVSGINSIHTLSLPFVGDAYNEEYLGDFFKNIKLLEKKMVLENNYLGNNDANTSCRTRVVNWLLKLQAELEFSESEYYIAVYLLDRVLATIPVAINMYQLVTVTSLWIASKQIGSNSLKASTIVNHCGNAYLIQQLIEMERKILRIVEFEVPTIEPSMCVNYYLKLFNLHQNDVAKLSALYITDCFSLLQEFSSTAVSVLAAAAVKFILNTYLEEERKTLHCIFKNMFSEGELDEMRHVETTLYTQLLNMRDDNYVYKEPYVKYSSHKTMLKVMNLKKFNDV